MVLFIHNKCDSKINYCGQTNTVVTVVNRLAEGGWITVKVKRDKTAMLINLSITNPCDAKKEFDRMVTNEVKYCAAFGTFNVVLNTAANNDCYGPDAFGDTVNAAARMDNALAFLDEPDGIVVEIKTRKSLNLGSGSVYVYKKQRLKL